MTDGRTNKEPVINNFMNENLIKRFLLEKAYEKGIEIPTFGEIPFTNSLYEKYKNGEIIINELEFEIWLENLKRNHRNFGRYLKSIGYLKNGDNLYEIASDEKISSINGICLNADKNLIISQTGEGCYSKPYNKPINGHLVINGIYDNELIYLSRLLKNKDNSFTIGYYGQGESLYTKKVLEYYKQLRKFLPLLTDEESIDVVEDTIFNRNKIYVLAHKKKPVQRKPVMVVTRYSER